MILLAISFFLSIFNIYISKHLFELDRCVINRGIAFGVSMKLIVFISIILLLVLIILGYINKGRIRYILFCIFLFGLSNLIVRLLLGGICDYISIPFLFFNIADLGIVLLSFYAGVCIIGINWEKNNREV